MRRTSAAIATLMALAMWAASTQSLVPTHDYASVLQLIDTVSSSLKQVQGLRQLGRSFADIKDSIGSLGQVANFKNDLIDVDFMRTLSTPKWSMYDQDWQDWEDWGPGGEGGVFGKDGERIREAERIRREERIGGGAAGGTGGAETAGGAGTDAGSERVGMAASSEGGSSESRASSPLIVRGGPPSEWDPEEAVDRPSLETAGQANKWTVNELYGVSAKGLRGQNRTEGERIKALRRTILQGAARNAYTIGAAAPAAMKEYEEEREHLAKQLDAATSLREETAVLGLAIIASLSGRAEQTLISASALELKAIELIAESPPLVTQEMKDRLLETGK